MPKRWRLLCVVTLTLGASAGFALAADKPAAPSSASAKPAELSISKLIDDLDSVSQDVRDAATTELMTRDGLSDDDFAAAMRSARTPEQRLRLHRVALQRFYSTFRPNVTSPPDHDAASLGILLGGAVNAQHDIIRPYQQPALKSPAVIITGTVPGFPAYAWLKPGDLVTALNGEPFTAEVDQARFAQRIKTLDAGTQVTLDIIRDGKPRHITLRLDSLQRLNEVVRSCSRNFEQFPPFKAYLQSLLGPSPVVPQIHVELPAPPPGSAASNAGANVNPGILPRRRNFIVFPLNRRIILNRPALPADARR